MINIIEEFIKKQKKRIEKMNKELHSDGPEISIEDYYYDEGYINSALYLLKELKKTLKTKK